MGPRKVGNKIKEQHRIWVGKRPDNKPNEFEWHVVNGCMYQETKYMEENGDRERETTIETYNSGTICTNDNR